jgi:hypothetical protein
MLSIPTEYDNRQLEQLYAALWKLGNWQEISPAIDWLKQQQASIDRALRHSDEENFKQLQGAAQILEDLFGRIEQAKEFGSVLANERRTPG